VPSFEPFPGIRYPFDHASMADVTAPPYDVIDDEERAALAARDEHNIVRLDLPVDGDDPYAQAGEALRTWLDAGVLVTDEPSFYVYRMTATDERGRTQRTTGVLGALELSRPGEGGILPHERTTPKAKSDRLNLLRGTAANLSAVWGLSPAAGLGNLLEMTDAPAASWADDDGVHHEVWLVHDADRIEKIRAAVGSAPVVIADGHHRYETSLAYRDERRAAAGDAPGDYDSVLTYVVELAEDALTVLPIHRLIGGFAEDVDLREALSPWFDVSPAGPVDAGTTTMMATYGCLVLVERGRCSLLTPIPDAMAGLRDLDTVRLDAALASLPEHELRYQHGVDNVVRAVERNEARAGVLLRPATVKQIIAIANGGERMPPKTTFFAPKPRTGVVLRSLG
jgi:uncharacterized protein (DUF1015 family)